MGWALYFTRSRIDLKVELESSYSELMLLITVESFSGILSLAWGYLGDRIGRKRMISIGLLSAMPMLLLGLTKIPALFLVLAAFANILFMVSQPSIMTALVIDKERSGRRLGMFNCVGSLGWAVGSYTMAYLSENLGPWAVYAASSMFIIFSLIIFSVNYPKSVERGVESNIHVLLRRLPFPTLGVSLAYMGIVYSSTILSIKLYYELGTNATLFALFYGVLPTLLGAGVNILIGVIADKIGGYLVTLISMISYAILFPLLYLSSGMLMAVLWIIPLYPLLYLGVSKFFSDLAPLELKATAMGAVSASLSLGGVGAGLLGPLTDFYGIDFSLFLSEVLILGGGLFLYAVSKVPRLK